MSQPSPEPDWGPRFWQNANLPLFVMRSWATSIEVFIRGGFGSRYLGWQAAAVLLLAPLYCMLKKVHDSDQLLWYLSLYLGMCFLHKQGCKVRQKRGEICHSFYDGVPALRKFFPFLKCSDVTFKRFIEPSLIVGLGALLVPNDEPLGMYVVIGGLCMGFLSNVCRAQEEARLTDLNDSILDQQGLAERLRQSRGDRF
ncbi:MAG: hypothetical protein IAG10_10615 [Planctomycetaceae bacterium]|nr:hypothetical protein [Planctomycetaceae bacterium]